MSRRNILPVTLICLVLTGLGLFAYMSQNPDSGLWVEAGRIPWVGEFFKSWHWYYKVEKQRAEGVRAKGREGKDGDVIEQVKYEAVPIPTTRQPGRRRPDGTLEGDATWVSSAAHVWVVPGVEIRDRPDLGGKVLLKIDAIANLPWTERKGDYFYVTHRDVKGWVYLPGYDEGKAEAPPLGMAPEPPGPLVAKDADMATVAKAREVFRGSESLGWLGPYQLYSDVKDAALLDRLSHLADRVEPVYEKRHGHPGAGEAKGAVVLYAREGAYRTFQAQSRRLRGLASTGHHDKGLVTLYVGDRHPDDVAATLVHELVHMMNRRALGPALPSWLDEGLCEDLAMSKIDGKGNLVVGEIGGRTLRTGSRIDFEGALTSFFRLRARLLAHELPTLVEIAARDWDGIAHSEERRGNYDLAGAWVRFLVEGEEGRRAAGWQSFLDHVASGGTPDAGALFAALGEDAELVEAGFRVWLNDRANLLLGPP